MHAKRIGCLAFLLAFALCSPAPARTGADEQRAVDAVAKSGGYVGWGGVIGDGGSKRGKYTAVHFSSKTDIDAVLKQLPYLKDIDKISFKGGSEPTDQHLKGLAVIRGLKLLELSGKNVTDEGMKVVASHKNLEVLYLRVQTVSDTGLKEL